MTMAQVSGPGADQLPEFVTSYYEQLRADYEAAKIPFDTPLPVPATWESLYRLEMATLHVRGEQDLRRSAWIVRLRFRNVAGESSYQRYLASLPPDPATASQDVLLADLVNLLRRTYYLIALAPASEAIRHKLLLGGVLIGLLCVAAVVVIVAELAQHPERVGIFQLALLTGAIGGSMSLIQRVQSLPEADPLLFRLSGSTTIMQSLLIPPLVGAIFAGLLFLIFVSGVLSGDVFPSFVVPPKSATGTDFNTFFFHTAPESGKAYALTIVWSFIAGFAERFVPDTIDRLTAQRTVEAKAGSASHNI
jgi:hypothetical protein